MTEFNKIERVFAKTLSRFPYVKRMAKNVYSRIVYAVNRKKYSFKCSEKLKAFGGLHEESFFGYYDKSPCNSKGMMLLHKSDFPTKCKPRAAKPINVCLFVSDQEQPVWSSSTEAYNWQQGSRLHWLNDDLFIYNDFDCTTKRYIAKVVSADLRQAVKQFLFPVQDSFLTLFYLSINYRRLMALFPDYGYRNTEPLTPLELASLDDDGIWRVEYETGSSTLLLTLAAICSFLPLPFFESGYHAVNHIMISPGGDKFIFIHRHLYRGRRFDRLLLANSDGSNLRLLCDTGMISHCCWVDENTLLGYLRGPGGKDAYWLIDVSSGKFCPLAGLEKFGDGHPYVVDGYCLTDTYPDKSRMQHLMLMNIGSGEVVSVGEFFHGFEYVGETRCDLHPRLAKYQGRYRAFFDSVFEGKRRFYELELSI